MISFVVAMGNNRVIGNNNKLPWDMPEDLKRFRTLTNGKAMIMGRKTYDSIGRPLPNRKNIILTRNEDFKAEGCVVVTTKDAALQEAAHHDNDEIMVIGGEKIFEMFMDDVDKIYLTIIDGEFDGTAFFPKFDESTFRVTEKTEFTADKENPHNYVFLTYEKIAQ